jgi:dTDP-4-dehydrorhamnose 3,5-epimerase
MSLKDVKIITPNIFEDDRGFFMEVFNKKDFEEAGIPTNFVQMNHSRSLKNVLRGLHFQWEPFMGKLMRVTKGSAYLVAVDIRKDSPTLGQTHSGFFSAENKCQMWAPEGFARGIYTLEDDTEVQYLITGQYNPTNESQIKWDDPDLNINWPLKGAHPIVSSKDATAQSFKEWLTSPNSIKFNRTVMHHSV